MDYARQQRNPARHLVGVGSVVLLHLVIVYALLTGLARKVVEVVKGPIEVKVIEEVIEKPPAPPEPLPAPPQMAAPPPPFIPPPEVSIESNIVAGPSISAVTREAPPGPQAPVIAKPVEAAPAPPKFQAASVVCPNYRQVMSEIVYPREALLEGLQGEVLIEFTVDANGNVKDVVIAKSTNRVFNRASLRAVQSLTCQGQGRDVRVQAPVSFAIR